MKRRLLYILPILFLLLRVDSNAQSVPWTVTPTAEEYRIVISDTVDFNITGFTLESGDYIGVLYDSATIKNKIGGMMEWGGFSDTIFAYGNTGAGPDNGFEDGEIFTFIIWDRSEDCFVQALSPTYFGGLEASFIDGGDTFLDELNGTNNNFFYAHDYFCQSYSLASLDPEPFKIGLFPNDIISFHSSQGLDLDTVSGAIDTENSAPGNYYVSWNVSESCLIQDSVPISIGQTFNDALDPNLKIKIDCGENEVDFTLDSAYFSNGLINYQILIYNTIDNVSINANNPYVSGLESGDYEITITDALGCVDTLSLEVKENNNCKNPVLTPELNDEFSTYKIDCSGAIKIYNRYGQLVKTSTGDLVWDGTNESGELVATGDYFIFCDEQKLTTITVIR